MAKSKGIGKGKHGNHTSLSNPANRGRKDDPKVNLALKEELTVKIIGWICDGISKAEIKNLVKVNVPVTINDDYANKIIRYAVEKMELISKQDAEVVIANHMELYEKIYKYYEEIGNAQGVNKALKAKEALSGVFKDSKKLVINEKKKTVIERVVEYDTSKLNPAEQARMNQLLDKAKNN